MAIYAFLGLLAALENVVPPVPADAAVALGAFLSHRGVTNPWMVFLVTWVANVGGAMGVYFAARGYGRRLFATQTGRRLLAPEALATIEREYLRFGLLGILIARFLPGIRAVVAPFAGLANLGALRAGVPMAIASALWYGGITLLGSVIGAEWERISHIVSGVNQTLGALTAVLVVGGAVWLLLRARRRRRERVWLAVQRAIGDTTPPPEGAVPPRVDPRAAALLVLELAYADEALTPADRDLVAEHLRARWGLEPHEHTPIAESPETPPRLARLRERILERFAPPQRVALVEQMWLSAFGDGAIGAQEDPLMHRAAELLGLDADELAAVRARLRAASP